MAIMRPGPLAGQLSGRVGGIVFSRNRGGDYVRNGPSPLNPQTSYQVAVRNALALASTRWNDMGASARAGWKAWAENNPAQNRLGESIRLQGNAAFVMFNSRLAYLGIAVVDTPPVISAPPSLLTLVPTFDVGAGAFQVAYTTTPLGAGTKLWVLGCRPMSLGISFVRNKLRHFITGAAAGASPLDIETAFYARFGTPAVGENIVVRAGVLGADGQLSAMLQASALVTTT